MGEQIYTLDNFLNGLQKLFVDIVVSTNNNEIQIYRSRGHISPEDKLLARIPIGDIEIILTDLDNCYTYTNNLLYTEKSLEILVDLQDSLSYYFIGKSNLDKIVCDLHGMNFSISKVSEHYLVALLCEPNNEEALFGRFPFFRYPANKENIAIFSDLIDITRSISAKVTTQEEQPLKRLKILMNSYLFNVSYNYNLVVRTIDKFTKQQRLRRRVKRGGQLFPYKNYNLELIKYYYQGLASDVPFTQYLAFYHVIEYYFQSISEEEAFQEIENFITRPSFSPYNTKEIKAFYEKIRKKMRDQREDGVWDEKNGLMLCLKKYVPDLQKIKNTISILDDTSIEYFSKEEVKFADNGKTIDFEESPEVIYCCIRDRIYSVRNSIVHSKEGEKLRYEPFNHDKELSREIPLIQAVAEEVIINSAKPIEIN